MLLSKESFEEYLHDQRIKALAVPRLPNCKIILDPHQKIVSLRIQVAKIPDLTLTERFRWISHGEAGTQLVDGELVVLADTQMFEAYLLLSDVASEFAESYDLDAAIRIATEGFSQLLEQETVLTIEKQVGLIGELQLLNQLLDLGWDRVIESWLGPDGGEHDYKLLGADIEVKSTTSEKRVHRITSLTQLKPVEGRRLLLASFQFTRATRTTGYSLSQLVSRLRADSRLDEAKLTSKLRASGWKPNHNHLYSTYFELRSDPAVFIVDDAFPRLIDTSLVFEGFDGARIEDVSYRINLDGLLPWRTLNQAVLLEMNVRT